MSETEGLLTADNSPASGEATDVFASVPRDVRFSADGNDKLARFNGKTIADVATSFLEVEKMSSGKAKLLTDESSTEDVSAFYQKLPAKFRAPDTVEGYGQLEGDNVSDGDKAYFGAIANAAHAKGIPTESLQGIIQAHNDFQDAKITADTNTTEETLQKEWVGDYKGNIEIIERVFREGADGNEFKAWFNSVGGGRSVVAMKAMLEIGKSTLDDKFEKGEPVPEEKDDYAPKYTNSPEQYRNDPTDEGIKARAWFEKNKGFQY